MGAKIFPRKAEALVVSLSKAANWDDDVSPRTDQRARVFVLRKVVASRGPEFDRTTYTCRIDDLFRHAGDGT